MKTRVLLTVFAGVLAVAGAFVVGYFGEDKAVPKAMPQTKPKSSSVKQVEATSSLQTVLSSKPVELSPEEAKRRAERVAERAKKKEALEKARAEREAKRREAEIERMKREELPDELRYKHRPKLPKHLQQRIDAERELRHLAMMEKRHPEQAEEFKKRRDELTKTLESLRHGGKPAEKISEVRKNVPEQIKENKQ